jgi:alkylresorcinol/alkylpyrone synthase
MAELLSISTTLPDHCTTASDTKRNIAATLPANAAARLSRMVDAAGNDTRYSALPLDQVLRLDTLEARNEHYREHAVCLGVAVARDALDKAEVDADDVSAIIGVSSTGYLMPTLETHLIERLRLSRRCRRVPLTQLGCAGGAAGLGLAAALSAGTPGGRVLVVSVELPSLSFPTVEPSPSDIVASMQFGDGAAAAVVSSGDAGRGPSVVASESVVFPETIDRDGVHLTSAGLRLMRPRGLAEILRQHLREAVDQFLARHDLTRREVGFWVIHPRNPELLDAAGAGLELPDAALMASRTIWRRSGNVISAAVFHVLGELRASAPPPTGALGVMIAFGAGFSCEMVLLRAAGWLCGKQAVGDRAGTYAAQEQPVAV